MSDKQLYDSMKGFHESDGLFFERTEKGVRITKFEPGEPCDDIDCVKYRDREPLAKCWHNPTVVMQHEMENYPWVSIVASMATLEGAPIEEKYDIARLLNSIPTTYPLKLVRA